MVVVTTTQAKDDRVTNHHFSSPWVAEDLAEDSVAALAAVVDLVVSAADSRVAVVPVDAGKPVHHTKFFL
jgi:hypothetical protein